MESEVLASSAKEMKNVWIDPPAGWKYGFPKLWNGEGNVFEWMIENGYPENIIKKMGKSFHFRVWHDEKE